MGVVSKFLIENIYSETVSNDVIVWVQKNPNDDPIQVKRSEPVEVEGTSIILRVEKKAGGGYYEPVEIKFPDLKMGWSVANPTDTSLTVKYKKFGNKGKIVIHLKNFKLLGLRPSPTTVNVQVGGN
jgi:hypothetical protein